MKSQPSLLKKTGILLSIFLVATIVAPFSPGILAALIPLCLLQFPGEEKLPRIIRWSYAFWWVEAVLGFGLLYLAYEFNKTNAVTFLNGNTGTDLHKNLSQFFNRYSVYELILTQALILASIFLYWKKKRELIWVLAAELAIGGAFSIYYIVMQDFHWYPILDESALWVGGAIVWFSFYRKWWNLRRA